MTEVMWLSCSDPQRMLEFLRRRSLHMIRSGGTAPSPTRRQWHGSTVGGEMIPLHRDPHFTFRFADDRTIPRFHVDGVGARTRVDVFRIDPVTGERLGRLTTGVVGDGGWVDVPEPIIVRAGGAFVAVPGEADA